MSINEVDYDENDDENYDNQDDSDYGNIFEGSQINRTIAEDGLPKTNDTNNDHNHTQPLTPDTLICIADIRSYVLMDCNYTTILEHISERKFNAIKHELREHYTEDGIEWTCRDGGSNVIVPVRKKCKHYKRQLIEIDGDKMYTKIERFCDLRKKGGTMYQIGEGAIYACEFRDPVDVKTERLLDYIDNKKIKQGRDREQVPKIIKQYYTDEKENE